MSRGSGSSVIPVAVFLAILLMVLPVSADNVTTSQTTVTTPQTSVTTSPTTIATQPINVTTSPTTIATTVTTATPVNTTVTVTQPTTVVTTIQPTVYATETLNTGSVNVYSSPTGASILIDGLYCGTTPKTVTDVAAGNHLLQLELSGYTNYEGSIYVVAGQTAEGYGTLQPINEGTSAVLTPVTNATVPVIAVVVTAAPEPTQDTGLLGNSTVLAAIISSVTVLIVTGISLYMHFTPPKKKE
jgi:hypothetical protein